MVTIEGTASLYLVKDQVDETLSTAEANLEQYVDDPEEASRLKTAVDQIAQLKGVFQLIELPGAALLVTEMEDLGRIILAQCNSDAEEQQAKQEKRLALLSSSLMILNHYLEYVRAKQYSLPVLLIPAINQLRSLTRKTLILESCFFSLKTNPARPPKKTGEPADHGRLNEISRRLRHMYQVGMLGLFKGESLQSNVHLMERALSRIDALSGDAPLAKLWWLGRGLLDAMGSGQLEANNARKSLLGMIDRHIKTLVAEGAESLQREPAVTAVTEAVFACSLVNPETATLKEIHQVFELDADTITDEQLRIERDLMTGPGGTVIRSVTTAIKEELTQIKDTLDLGARGAQEDDESFVKVSEAMKKIGNTLLMLGLVDASQMIKVQAEKVKDWTQADVDPEAEGFNAVADTLLYVENCISALVPLTGGVNASMAEAEQATKKGMSIGELEQARLVVVNESRAGLSLARRAITSFIDSEWDCMHLNNVPVTMTTVWGGLTFLHQERAAALLKACEHFISNQLLSEKLQPDQHTLETLADAITSIDYYLENLEDKKPMGDSILDVAEDSVAELGYPVPAA